MYRLYTRAGFLAVAFAALVLTFAAQRAEADSAWSAPDVTMGFPAAPTVQDYTLSVSSTGTDYVNSYNLKVTLTRLTGTAGSVTFGTAFEAASDYLFSGVGHSGWFATTNTTDTVVGTDAQDAGGETTLTGPRNLCTIPLNIAAGTVGQWSVAFDPGGSSLFRGNAGGWAEITSSSYNSGTITITPEPATLAIVALGGLGVLLRRRRR